MRKSPRKRITVDLDVVYMTPNGYPITFERISDGKLALIVWSSAERGYVLDVKSACTKRLAMIADKEFDMLVRFED